MFNVSEEDFRALLRLHLFPFLFKNCLAAVHQDLSGSLTRPWKCCAALPTQGSGVTADGQNLRLQLDINLVSDLL